MRKSVSVELVSPKQTALLVYKPMKPKNYDRTSSTTI